MFSRRIVTTDISNNVKQNHQHFFERKKPKDNSMEEKTRNSLIFPEEDARDSNNSLGKMKVRRSNNGNNINPE